MRYRYESRGKVFQVSLERQAAGYRASVDGQSYDLEILDIQPGMLSLRFEGRPTILYWAQDGDRKWVSVNGCTYLLEKPSALARRSGEGAAGRAAEGVLRAPMPAQVRAVEVAEGDPVEKGQTLLLLEAMKMEIRLRAPQAGRVTRLAAAAGQTVERDQILIEIGGPEV